MKFSAGVLGNQRAPVAAALVFDTSKRMDYRHENRTRLEAAQELSLWLLAQFPEDSQIAVLTSRAGGGAFQVDRGAAKHRIERLETAANVEPSLVNSIDEAVRLVSQSDRQRKEIYVFTDLAKVAWPDRDAPRLQERLRQAKDVGVYVIDVGIAQPSNLALGKLRLSSQVVSKQSSLTIEADVSSTGIGGTHTVELDLLEPDPKAKTPGMRKAENRGQQTITIEPGQSQHVPFNVSGLSLGTHQGSVQILGQDGLSIDNQRFFTIDVKPPWPILIVAPEKGKTQFLAAALAPKQFTLRGKVRFTCEVVTQDSLERTDLKRFAALCLLDPKPLDDHVWQKLADYVADGHGLSVFLGRNAEPVTSFNTERAQSLLAGKLVRQGPRLRRPLVGAANFGTSGVGRVSQNGAGPLAVVSRLSVLAVGSAGSGGPRDREF